jgi:hypothetical protein
MEGAVTEAGPGGAFNDALVLPAPVWVFSGRGQLRSRVRVLPE